MKYSYITLLLLCSVLCLSACTHRQKGSERPILTVSIEPLRYVVEAIAGDHYRVKTIMPQGASPETYEPTPRQMMELTESRAIFRTGSLGFEQTKLPQMVQGVNGAPLVDLGEGIVPIEDHDHDHGTGESIDPHLWMSPGNLKVMAQNAYRALCRLDSAGAPYYRTRLAQFETRMDSLHKAMQQMLKPLDRRAFLIYHPALGYLARDYGLKQLAVEHDGKDPSAAFLKVLTQQCRAEGVRTVFISKEHAGATARRLAETLHAQVVVINPLDYDVPAQMTLIARSLKR